MSTNATISRYNENSKKIELRTVHYDGYLGHVGSILFHEYNKKNIDILFQNKNIIYLNKKEHLKDLKKSIEYFDSDNFNEIEFDNLYKYMKYFKNKESPFQFYEYNYIFIKNTWFLFNKSNNNYLKLSKEIFDCKIEKIIDKSVEEIIKENDFKIYSSNTLEEYMNSKYQRFDSLLNSKIKNLKKLTHINSKIEIDIDY